MTASDHPHWRAMSRLTRWAQSLTLPALLRISLLAAIVGALVIAGTLAAAYLVNGDNERWASRNVARAGRMLRDNVQDERNHRFDFAATRSAESAAGIDSARAVIATGLDRLIALTRDNAAQQHRLAEIRRLVDVWHATPPALPAPRSRAPAIAAFAGLSAMITEFIEAEDALYVARVHRAQVQLVGGATVVGAELLLLIGALLLIRFRAIEQASELETQTAMLQDQAVQLENNVTEVESSEQELQETVRELEQQRAVLHSLLDSSPVGIALYDQHMRCVMANATLAAIDGTPVEVRLGRTPREFMDPQLAEQVVPLYEDALATGQVHRLEVTVRAGKPDERRLDATLFPVKMAGGVTGVGVLGIDITERVRVEQQLRHSQKMEAVGRLAGGVAHDFNNLLMVIRSYVDLLEFDMELSSMQRAYANEIRSAADRAATLTRRLLAFSRKDVLLPRLVDVNEVIYDAEKMLQRLIVANVDMQLSLRPDLGSVYIDPGQLEQVLMNLTINAADAMPEGGHLTIETASVAFDDKSAGHHAGMEPGRYVAIVVTDTGVGMDEETRSHIFEPFFTTKPPGQGTGLGLSTVYGIVKQAQGHITVHSHIGHGSRFTVYLPRKAATAEAHAQRSAAPAALGGNETILLVEDEEGVRDAVRRYLERQGYTVLTARHGGKALRIAAEHDGRIDLVLTDLMMPELAGRRFVERLRESRDGVRVLFMSGYTDDDVVRLGLLEAGNAFIQKPFALEELAERVREVLDAVK